MRKICLRIALAAVVILASTAPLGQGIERPQWRKGDTWTYKSLELANSAFQGTFEGREVFSVIDVLPDGYDVAIRRLNSDGSEGEVWHGRNSLNANPITRASADGSWAENTWLRWPYEVGKQWSIASKQKDGTSFQRDTSITAWEDINVPAGHFRALRIDTEFAKGRYVREETWWYAPEVKRYVRFEARSRIGPTYSLEHTVAELVAFSLH